jgi:hypothetical protein
VNLFASYKLTAVDIRSAGEWFVLKTFKTGLPDFSWYNIPKRGKNNQ